MGLRVIIVKNMRTVHEEGFAADEFTDAVSVVAAMFRADKDAVELSVAWSKPTDGTWDNDGITEELVGETHLECSHSALNLDSDMVGKQIRLYWRKEKRWFPATIKCYEQCTCLEADGMQKELHHHIVYQDGDEEWCDLLRPGMGDMKDVPAWEVAPFTEDRFSF